MNTHDAQGAAWADLLIAEMEARSAQHRVTNRAMLYLHAGLVDVEGVCDALKISRATWYRRVSASEDWKNENRAAGQRVSEMLHDPDDPDAGTEWAAGRHLVDPVTFD